LEIGFFDEELNRMPVFLPEPSLLRVADHKTIHLTEYFGNLRLAG